MSEPHTN